VRSYLKDKKLNKKVINKRAVGMAPKVEHLPSTCEEVLESIPSTENK
jgi:hypothetical protein